MAIHPAETLILRFARETGLTAECPPRRYLWTDAHALCTLLGLHDHSGDERYREWALELVDQVHRILGSHHPDDPRSGPLGSADAPLSGGLRIGKPLPERRPGRPEDPATEWDRDGQYFHYLTRWIHALCRAARYLAEPSYVVRALELAHASAAFFTDGGMVWKMGTGLDRPLVDRMGQHDPVDGLVTFLEVRHAARAVELDGEGLAPPLDHLRSVVLGTRLVTPDPLGIGGLLFDAFRLHRLEVEGSLRRALVEAASVGIAHVVPPDGDPVRCLAFRELGLAVGLHAAAAMGELPEHWGLAAELEDYWLERSEWQEHADINRVMLATSLAPAGFLGV